MHIRDIGLKILEAVKQGSRKDLEDLFDTFPGGTLIPGVVSIYIPCVARWHIPSLL